jgi:hypothetical protein
MKDAWNIGGFTDEVLFDDDPFTYGFGWSSAWDEYQFSMPGD